MAEDQTPDPADQPEDDKTPPSGQSTRALSFGRFRAVRKGSGELVR